MSDSSQDFILRVLGFALAFAGPTGLLAWRQYKQGAKAAPISLELVAAQTEKELAAAEQIRRQTEREERAAALSELRERIAALKSEIQEARAEREVSRAAMRLLEKQNEDLSAQKRCAEIEIAELRSRLPE
jgi:molybdopterin converting factor small subunit